MIFSYPASKVSQANIGGYVDYWDFDVPDADEVVVFCHRCVGYVGGVDSPFDVFFGEGFWFDEVCEEDDAFCPVEGKGLAGDVHDEGDHGGKVGLACETGEAGDNDLLGWCVDYGDQGGFGRRRRVACVKAWRPTCPVTRFHEGWNRRLR